MGCVMQPKRVGNSDFAEEIRSGYRSGSQLSKIVLNNTYTLRYVSYTYYFILGLGLGLILYYFAELAAGPISTSEEITIRLID